MSSSEAEAGREALQFDRVESAAPSPDAVGAASPTVTCSACGKAVGLQYFHVDDKPVCTRCRSVLAAAASTPRTAGPLVRAGFFGLGAAIAGAAIYYAVIAITNFEIGLVAVLIGYMVGYSVRKGAAGRGGRRFQVLALVLTYWAVGLAYTPLAFKEYSRGKASAAMLSDSTDADDETPISTDSAATAVTTADDAAVNDVPAATSADPGTTAKDDEPMTGRAFLLGVGMLFVFVFALPVVYIIGSFPGGILSAIIIFIGLRQAWSMTASQKLEISGPYKVGTGPTPATG
jgi:hypothetical protein